MMSKTVTISMATTEEEDAILQTRIILDERQALRRLMKKFHSYTSLSHPTIPQPAAATSPASPALLQEARDMFLVELASYQLLLKKTTMACDAERRQADEYRRQKHQIGVELESLHTQIGELKLSLEQAQLERRQRIEYDVVADRINTLPSRDTLESSIHELEAEMRAIQEERDHQSTIIRAQKDELDRVLNSLIQLRLLGKSKATVSSAIGTPSVSNSPLPEPVSQSQGVPMDIAETNVDSDANKRSASSSSAPSKRTPSSAPSTTTEALDDDFEMGEVSENRPVSSTRSKKKAKEDLEEGEASDSSSVLSEPPGE